MAIHQSNVVDRKSMASLVREDEAQLFLSLGRANAPRVMYSLRSAHEKFALSDDPEAELPEAELRKAKKAHAVASRRLRWAWRRKTKDRLRVEIERLAAEITRLKLVVAEETLQARLRKEAAEREFAEQGRSIFQGLIPDIRSALCEQWHACEKIKRYEDQTSLGMAVADVLATVVTAAPVATVSALVVKMGLKKFCNCHAP